MPEIRAYPNLTLVFGIRAKAPAKNSQVRIIGDMSRIQVTIGENMVFELNVAI